MSVRRRLLAVLDSLHVRLVGVEDDAERNAATQHRSEQALARIEQKLDERFARLERAVVEQGRTLGQSLADYRAEASRVGQAFKQHEETLFNHEGRLGHLEKAGANGAE